MDVAARLAALLPGDAAKALRGYGGAITEIRLRAGMPVRMAGTAGEAASDAPVDAEALRGALTALMEHSVYARQAELDRGFFTLEDGSRVGVCGRMFTDGDRVRMAEIGSACVRVARAIPGCADAVIDAIDAPEGPRPTLILSPPGMGKTTMLRDIARQLSERGYDVGVADERRELAACRLGVPTLDVGPRTDVMDGCPRPEAIQRLVRSMAPRVIVADEIGGTADAGALSEAARCGVAVVASAHAGGMRDARARRDLGDMLNSVALLVVLLGPRPGVIRGVWRLSGEGESPWKSA